MPRLLIEPPGEPPRIVDLRDGLTVGRSEGVDIVLLDMQVSREHLRFEINRAGDVSVVNLSSSHGTLVNGKPIERHYLDDGDVIQVGRVRIELIDPDEASLVVQLKEPGPSPKAPATKSEAERRLNVFYSAASAMRQPADIDAMLGELLEAIIDNLECDRGVIGLYDDRSAPEQLRRITRVRGGQPPGEIIISRTLIDATMQRRQAIIASGPLRTETLREQKVVSAMGAPLLVGQRILGFIYVDDRAFGQRFLEKDLAFLDVLAHLAAAAIDSAERHQRLVTASLVLRAQSPLEELIGDSPAMRRLKAEIQRFAPSQAHVLLRGETGTGKELVARTLHALSQRASMPLVIVNCAAMPDTMVESLLFGHVKGAFTGAVSAVRGMFVLADNGTLFLDEIGDLSLSAQAKLLRAVQQGEVQPLGSEKTLRVNVRIIAATHKDLAAEVAAGRFREDLYYRLSALELIVPPLRERPEDIPQLARAFLAAAVLRTKEYVAGFTPEALAALSAYRFPGNVRELQNEVERLAIHAPAEGKAVIDIELISERILGAGSPEPETQRAPRTLAEVDADLERRGRALVVEALAQASGNISEAARLLGITRAMMRGRMKRLGLLGVDEPE